GLHGEASFAPVELVHFSPPIRTKTWFHQGPVGDEFGEWGPAEYEAEFWLGDRQQLGQRDQTVSDLQDINDRRVKRDALRTLRGQILRTELYAMDGMSREDRPYTVTESLFGIREESEP